MAVALATLRLARRFKEAGVPEAHAEVFVDALRQAQETGLANLATKADLELLRAALKADVEAARRDAMADTEKLDADVRTMNADLRGEIARSKNSMLMWL